MWYRVIVTSVGFLQFHILFTLLLVWSNFSCRIVWILTLFFGGYQYHPLTNQPVAINPGHDGGESGGTPWRPSDVCGRCRKLLRDRSGELRAGHRCRNCDSCTVLNYTYRTLGKIILCLVLVLLSVAEGSLEVSVVARNTFPINMHETRTTTNYQAQVQLQLTTTNYYYYYCYYHTNDTTLQLQLTTTNPLHFTTLHCTTATTTTATTTGTTLNYTTLRFTTLQLELRYFTPH